MTPKEKAKELVESYKYRLLPFITFQTQLTETDLLNKCKQCAKIAADEVINTIMSVYQPETKAFWFEVKQEIEKL
jgi:hypothetical protein